MFLVPLVLALLLLDQNVEKSQQFAFVLLAHRKMVNFFLSVGIFLLALIFSLFVLHEWYLLLKDW